MKFKIITTNTPEYQAARMLRWEVLAKPLGMPPESEVLPEEMQSLHLIALDGKRIVGCICFHPESNENGRIFEIAVSEEYQGHGFARQLLHALERILIQKGFQNVFLFAIPEMEEFYCLMGYQPQEEIIMKRGVQQRMMKKNLPLENSMAHSEFTNLGF